MGKKKLNKRNIRLENFNLTAGIIGLIADIVGLGTLIIQDISKSPSSQANIPRAPNEEILFFAFIVSLFFFIVIYSYFTIAVVLLAKYVPEENLYNSRVVRPAIFLGTFPYAIWCGYVVLNINKILGNMTLENYIPSLVSVSLIAGFILIYLPGIRFLITSAADLVHFIKQNSFSEADD